ARCCLDGGAGGSAREWARKAAERRAETAARTARGAGREVRAGSWPAGAGWDVRGAPPAARGASREIRPAPQTAPPRTGQGQAVDIRGEAGGVAVQVSHTGMTTIHSSAAQDRQDVGKRPSRLGLSEHGIHNARRAYWNLGAAQLVEESIVRREGFLASGGPLVVRTGKYTGRSPGDKFLVRDQRTEADVDWGAVNQPMTPEHFRRLHQAFLASLDGKDLFVQDCFAGADPAYRLPIRVIAELAWHSLFAHQLFVRPDPEETEGHVPQFTLIFAPSFKADPDKHGTRTETGIILNFAEKLVLIAGTSYAGEMKKSVFSILNHLLPERGVFPMHCSANVGPAGDVALFFGLSGTGKTTLSAHPRRQLVGDDGHGWSDQGIFNFEGGCYAKCIRLSRENEPQIWNAIRFGTVLENVVLDPEQRLLDFNDDSITENTRAAYPVGFIDNA